MKARLTDAYVKSLKPPHSGQFDVWDEILPGFGLRVSQGGSRTWFIMYRANGQRRRYNLGRFPLMGLAEARIAARAYMGDVARDQDPARERADAKAEPTFADVAAEYIKRHAQEHKRPRSVREDEKMLRSDLLPAWGKWKVSAIERRHIVSLLDEIVDRGAPIQANRTKSLISTIFNFAENRSLLKYNPAVRLKAPAPKGERDRVLSEDELHRLFLALANEPPRRQAIVKTALMTAARRGEVINMSWDEIDDHGWWTIPGARTKNGREHRVPLVPSVLEMIRALPKDEAFVFHGRKQFGQASSRPSEWFNPCCARAGIEGAVFHDLRRSASTHMNRIGIDGVIIERLLNHVQSGVTGIYNRYAYDHEKRAALLRWERELERIISGEKRRGTVVGLRA